jgi:iron(III) transport system permease protein
LTKAIWTRRAPSVKPQSARCCASCCPNCGQLLCGGALLVALHLLAEYGVMQMMQFPTLTTAIMQQYAVGFSDAAGSLLSTMLITLCLLMLTIEVLARGRARIARVGRGSWQRPSLARLGWWTAPVTAALAILVGLAGRTTCRAGAALVGASRSGPSSGWVITAADHRDDHAACRSRWPGCGCGCAARRVVANAASVRLGHRLERLTFVASALPGVVVALALVIAAVQWAQPMYQTVGLVVLAYLILFLPRAMVTWRAGLAATPPELSEAARSLGVGPVGAIRRVVLPLVAPSAVTGFILVFLATTTELTATLLLAPTGTQTLATAFWAASDELDYAASAPYAAVMIMLSAPLTLLLRRQILQARMKCILSRPWPTTAMTLWSS